MTPTFVPSTAASLYVAWMPYDGGSCGMNVKAVRVFSVLAGAYRPCAFFAARISPVSRSPRTYDDACTAGGAGMPGTRLVTTPGLVSSGPPITVESSPVAAAGVETSAKKAPPAAAAHSSRRGRRSRRMTRQGYRDG